MPGIALWRYDDWADTIMDGWVLRLGVGAAEAFDYSIGDQGLGFGGETAVRATPVHAILGNFLHLDDGEFVRSGAYVSTRRTLDETNRLLTEDAASEKPYRGVLLTFAGGLQGLREATEHVARWKRTVRDARLVSLHRALVRRLRRAGARHPRRGLPRGGGADRRAGAAPRPAGRGAGARGRPGALARHRLRRRAGGARRRAAARPRPRRRGARRRPGRASGCGSWRNRRAPSPLAALLRAMQTEPFAAEAGPFFEMLQSVDLVAPPLSAAEYAALAMYLNAGWGPAHPERRIRLHLPKVPDEKRLAVPPYSRSYFELVRRAFHRRGEDDGARGERRRGRSGGRPRSVIAAKWDRLEERAPHRAGADRVAEGAPRPAPKARSASSSLSTGRTSAAA